MKSKKINRIKRSIDITDKQGKITQEDGRCKEIRKQNFRELLYDGDNKIEIEKEEGEIK